MVTQRNVIYMSVLVNNKKALDFCCVLKKKSKSYSTVKVSINCRFSFHSCMAS